MIFLVGNQYDESVSYVILFFIIFTETVIDAPPKETKEETTPVSHVAPSPLIVAPMAAQEDSSLDEVIEHNIAPVLETSPPKKMNGSVVTHVLETTFDANVTPDYEPEQTILEDSVQKVQQEIDESYDTEEDATKSSLEEQIRDLENYIIRKDSEPQEPNHVKEEPVIEEMVQPVKAEKNQSAVPAPKENDVSPVIATPTTQVVESKANNGGIGCCKILFITFFFIFVTLAVTLVVILNSNIKHPMLTELRHQLKFIDPVRDFITHKVQAILKKKS